jgi:hypothetical protein
LIGLTEKDLKLANELLDDCGASLRRYVSTLIDLRLDLLAHDP